MVGFVVDGHIEDSTLFSTSQLDTALRVTGLGKKSKQRFLKASCMDNFIRRARKGAGGNTVVYTCVIVKQTAVAEGLIKRFREGAPNFGTKCTQINVCYHE